MAYQRTRRYPEINSNVTMEELSRKWSEMVRELNTRDTTPIPPADIYGRNYNSEPVFVTAGTSLPIAPTPAYWNVYQYEIPANAGMVLVAPVSVSAAANVQVQTYLPPAQFSEGRTISIVFDSGFPVSGYSTFNLGIFARPEVSNTILPKDTTVAGTLNIGVTTATVFVDISGNSIASNNFSFMALNGATVYPTYAVNLAGPSLASNPISMTLRNNTSTSASLSLNYAPLTKTFRAFDKRWIQIA